LAKAVGYYSAGTVEMLVDDKKNFFFLEMNTRLQVEHPVTEEITGLDLVREMIRVAAGHPLSITDPTKVPIKGWAMEARVYAEDPARNFLPSIGTLKRYEEPKHLVEGIRCDSGVSEGAEISIYYDPMICKLISHGADRKQCVDRLRDALDSYVIQGVNHNIPFLREVLDHPDYLKGDITTKWLEQKYPKGFKGHVLTNSEKTWLAIRLAAIKFLQERLTSVSPVESMELSVKLDDHAAEEAPIIVKITASGGSLHASVGGSQSSMPLDLHGTADGTLFTSEKTTLQVMERRFDQLSVRYMGTQYTAMVQPVHVDKLSAHMPVIVKPDMSKVLVSPMPGTLISVEVKPGDRVVIGQEIAVVEAMKMRNILRAQADAVVKKVTVTPGTAVAVEQVLVEFE
jgi:propionyl-CoA carboxylase alpha chain